MNKQQVPTDLNLAPLLCLFFLLLSDINVVNCFSLCSWNVKFHHSVRVST